MLVMSGSSVALDIDAAVREHGAHVSRSLRHLGVRDQDIEDVAQEVFLVLHRTQAKWSPERGSLRAWLYGIALRRTLHYRRSLARRRDVLMEEQPEPSVEASVEARRDARWVAGWVLDQLDDEKRAVFVLFEIEGLPMKEIVAVVGCPLKTGYSRLEAARRVVADAHGRARKRGWI